MYNSAMRLCGKMVLRKWFDKPFDRLTVLSRVEGLTTLSQPVESLKVERVEGQITRIEIQNPKLVIVSRQYSIINMLCIINLFSACQHSYLDSLF